MKHLRRHRLRTRFALLAMMALLWSQLVLAAHPGCIDTLAYVAAIESTTAPDAASTPPCDHGAKPVNRSTCEAHCSQGDLSSEQARVPSVPPLLAPFSIPLMPLAVAGARLAPAVESPPPLSWHRPTSHPAALLLI